MAIIAEAVRHLMAAGVTGEALLLAIADMEAAAPSAKDEAAERRRERDRLRKRRNPQNSAESAETPAPPFPPLSPEPPITTLSPPPPPIVPPTPDLAAVAERIWAMQPLVGGKRRSPRPDVLKALKAAVNSRRGDPDRIEAACQVYYRLPDCRKDGGQFAKGAAALLAEDRWREFEPGPQHTPAKPATPATPEIIAKRVQHYRDTGEWRPAWGDLPEDPAPRKALEIAK